MRKKLLGQEHPDVAGSLNNLSVVLRLRGDLGGTEGLLLEAWKIAQPGRSAPPDLQRTILDSFVRLYEAWEKVAPNTGKAAQAAEWKKKLAEFDQAAAAKKPAPSPPRD